MDKKSQETIHTWNKIAQLYADRFMDLTLYNESYDLFCDALKKSNASVLEIGCGPGNISKYLLHRRPDFKIKATDVSENMIEIAKSILPDLDFQVLDCRTIEIINEKFDGLICGFTLPYISFEECEKFIKDCSELLVEEAILYLSFVSGDYQKSGFIAGNSGLRTYFYYHDLAAIQALLLKNSFSIMKQLKIAYQQSAGKKEIHMVLIAKKKAMNNK